jgi:hypothetical protein
VQEVRHNGKPGRGALRYGSLVEGLRGGLCCFRQGSRGDRLRAGLGKAEFADAVPAGRGKRRAEDTAGVWPELVEIAGASHRIEHWARFVVAEGIEVGAGLRREASRIGLDPEASGDRITRERWGEPLPGGRRTLPDAIRTIWIGLREPLQPILQPPSVCGSDREDAVAALGTSRTAEQVGAAASRCEGKGAIYQGNEGLVPRDERLLSLPGTWAGLVI